MTSKNAQSENTASKRRDHNAAMSVLQNYLANLNERRTMLVTQLQHQTSEVDALYDAPLCRMDVLEIWRSYIDRVGEEYLKNYRIKMQFVDAAHAPRNPNEPMSPLTFRDILKVEGPVNMDFPLKRSFGFKFFGEYDTVGNLDTDSIEPAAMFFFGDLIKQKITAHFDELFEGYNVPASEIGPPIAERRKALTKLNAMVEKIESEIAEIDGEIEEARGSFQTMVG